MARKSLLAWSRDVFPIVAQLQEYRSSWLLRDVSAGLAIASVALPIGVAYPAIAGLPPVVGLYSSILPLVAYAIFGSSRQLIVGPDAATLTILAASLAQLSLTAPEQQRAAFSAAFALAVGVMCLLSGALRLGFIANFLSRPILTGYLCGISLTLLISQIGRLTTVPIESKGLVRPLIEFAGHITQIHVPTLVFGLGLLLLLRLIRYWSPRSPGPLVAVIIGALLSLILDLQAWGVATVGKIPAALPSLTLPMPRGLGLDDLVLDALGILAVSFGSGIVTARSFGAKNRYRVNANRELIGFGAANIACGLFGGFPVSGADSRTAINDAVGGRTQLAALVAAAALTFVLVALTDAMKYLPVAALGAIIASAAIDLFDVKELRRLWQTSHAEFLFALIAMLGVIGLGVLRGVLIAIIATFVYLLARVSRPSDALMGCIPGRDGFYKLHREPSAKAVPGLAIYLVQSSLVFFNIDYVRDRIMWIVDRLPQSTRWFILDAEAITTIDGTAAAVLGEVSEELSRRNLRFGVASLHAQPRDLLARSGFLQRIGTEMSFPRIEDAALAFRNSRPDIDHTGSHSNPDR
ncbi:MAG TPA: SulP family inorganic anion transporter [Stellaceae bacterium]|nr:SulP family inorganic anion transporter [Stellaceae bacterium]